jgi:hypothetical protein
VEPDETTLEAGDPETIEINYQSPSQNPDAIEFVVEYDPDVMTVTEVSEGGYLSDGIGGKSDDPGRVGFGRADTDGEPADKDSGTVATITVELADGVSEGDTTPIEFTSVKTGGGSHTRNDQRNGCCSGRNRISGGK